MSTLIFRLNHVEEDEAEEVRQLLRDHELEFYETNAGRWGVSVAGLWLKDESRADHARSLLQDYAEQRQRQQRIDYLEARRRGELPSHWQRFKLAPARYIAIGLLVATIAYLSISPFLNLAGD